VQHQSLDPLLLDPSYGRVLEYRPRENLGSIRSQKPHLKWKGVDQGEEASGEIKISPSGSILGRVRGLDSRQFGDDFAGIPANKSLPFFAHLGQYVAIFIFAWESSHVNGMKLFMKSTRP